jgi:lambda repressor-like predicted transcriptional regulator
VSTSSISSSTSTLTGLGPATGARRHPGGGLLQTAAQALGLSTDDLVSQLKSGKSLDDVASEQGVSHDDLAAAIKAGMPPERAADADADATVESIISRKGMPDRPQGPPPPARAAGDSASGVLGSSLTDAQQSTLDALSDLLGTDSSSLMDSLKSGSSTLADLLSAKGVDQSSLASILQDGLLFDATT